MRIKHRLNLLTAVLLALCAFPRLGLAAGNITDGLTSGADITTLAQAAFAAAAVTHKTVHIGDGDWTDAAPLYQNGFSVQCESENTHISYTGDMSQVGAAYTVSGSGAIDGRLPTLKNLTLTGPWRGAIGSAPPNLIGIDVLSQARIDGVTVGNFLAGVTDDSAGGHVYLTACKLCDNVFGFYERTRNGDARVSYCDLTGNTLAAFGMTPTGGLQSSSIIGTHMGFCPYCFYKQPGQPPDGQGVTFLGRPDRHRLARRGRRQRLRLVGLRLPAGRAA